MKTSSWFAIHKNMQKRGRTKLFMKLNAVPALRSYRHSDKDLARKVPWRHMQHSFSSSGHLPQNHLVGVGAQGWMEMPAYCLVILTPCSCKYGSAFALSLAKPHQLEEHSLRWWKCTSDVPYITWRILGLTEVKAREPLPLQNATLAQVLLKFFI